MVLTINQDMSMDEQLAWLALTTKDIISAKFPGRAVLTPEEVAEVWKGKTTRGVVEGIRAKLKRGRLIPGLKKRGGRWEVPVSDLINVIDGLADDSAPRDAPHPEPPSPEPEGRRKTPIGPGRWGVLDFKAFWDEVFDHLDDIYTDEEKDTLTKEISRSLPSKPPKDF